MAFRLPVADDCVLVVIDIQEKLAMAMPPRHVSGNVRRTAKLIRAADGFGVPVLWTEQAPLKLGPTLPLIREAMAQQAERQAVEKTAFSCLSVPAFRTALETCGRRHLILCGMETHICVLQTALAALAGDYAVSVIPDAVVSRHGVDHRSGLANAERGGASLLSFETLLYGWMNDADSEGFRKLSGLTRDRDE